jgi:diketogulonate reductase-like aldo/keto reductase
MNTVEVGEAEIPSLGFGTLQLSGDRCRSAVKTALESGYRHVDTAEYYENEAAVGAAYGTRTCATTTLSMLQRRVWTVLASSTPTSCRTAPTRIRR